MTQKLDLGGLARFLVRAKIESYAGNGREVTSERPGFKELEFAEGDWNYRDSYVGFFMAPGQEIARFQGSPVWAMSYNGGMLPDYRNHVGYAKEVFTFLKKALSAVDRSMPFRGPEVYGLPEGGRPFVYTNKVEGDITSFRGHEEIADISVGRWGLKVFEQDYIGGLILPKPKQ